MKMMVKMVMMVMMKRQALKMMTMQFELERE